MGTWQTLVTWFKKLKFLSTKGMGLYMNAALFGGEYGQLKGLKIREAQQNAKISYSD